jgi:flagellar biosynthesis protein FlhG
MFASAADDVLVVVCDEPASITDAYALIKVLSRDHGVRRVRILANMVRSAKQGQVLYRKLARVTDRYLDVVAQYAGYVPHDDLLQRALRSRQPVVTAFPDTRATHAFKKLAESVDTWDRPSGASGGIQFFLESAVGTAESDRAGA